MDRGGEASSGKEKRAVPVRSPESQPESQAGDSAGLLTKPCYSKVAKAGWNHVHALRLDARATFGKGILKDVEVLRGCF